MEIGIRCGAFRLHCGRLSPEVEKAAAKQGYDTSELAEQLYSQPGATSYSRFCVPEGSS